MVFQKFSLCALLCFVTVSVASVQETDDSLRQSLDRVCTTEIRRSIEDSFEALPRGKVKASSYLVSLQLNYFASQAVVVLDAVESLEEMSPETFGSLEPSIVNFARLSICSPSFVEEMVEDMETMSNPAAYNAFTFIRNRPRIADAVIDITRKTASLFSAPVSPEVSTALQYLKDAGNIVILGR